ncbi:MAG: response regulator [Ekhidna sp.]
MKVLIVDDSMYMRSLIKSILVKHGYEIIGEASTGEQAIDLSIELEPDIITMDNILPDMKGVDILLTLKEEGLDAKVVMVSAVGQEMVKNLAFDRGAIEYIVKPFNAIDLMNAMSRLKQVAV